jgi:hypothetical protein
MTELDENADLNRETFALYGLAMYHAQCVEKSLAILVSSVFNKEFHNSNANKREEIQKEEFAKTMGRLLNRLKTQITIPPNLEKTLVDSLKKRNWLAHEYFWEKNLQMHTTTGKKKMIEELEGMSDFFSKLDAHLTKISENAMKKMGVSEKEIDERVKQLIQNAKNSI